jgi:HSP20 family protein
MPASWTRPNNRPEMREIMYAFTRRDPFAVLLDEVFTGALRTQAADCAPARPAARARFDVIERGNVYEVTVDLPGAKKEAIEIDVHGKTVSIAADVGAVRTAVQGEAEEAASDAAPKEPVRVLVAERHAGRLARRFELPEAIAEDAVQAVFQDGVLTLTLPKKAAPQAKRVNVH